MDPETMRGWWFGWRCGNDRRVEGELLRSHAAILREEAALLRQEASFTRWYSERQREYGRYLRDQLAALRSAPEPSAPWLVPRPSDPAADPVAVPVAAVPEGGKRRARRTPARKGATVPA